MESTGGEPQVAQEAQPDDSAGCLVTVDLGQDIAKDVADREDDHAGWEDQPAKLDQFD